MAVISHMAKITASPFFAISGGTTLMAALHHWLMAKKHKIRIFPREWRKKAGLNLEKASERLQMAVSYLSDLEKGKRRWNQDHLDAFASAYGIDAEDLFWNPEVGPPLWRIFNSIPAENQAQAAKILETFAKKTGTDN